MTLPQAAEHLGMHRTRLWQLVRDGKVAAEKIGRDWLIDDQELDRLKAQPIPSVGYPRGRPRKPAAAEGTGQPAADRPA